MSVLRIDARAAVALLRADLVAGQRAPGLGSRVGLARAGAALLAALVALGAVALAVFVHGLTVGGSPAAAAGALDLALVATLVAGVVSPMSGGPTARIVGLARGTAAPVGARAVLLAAVGRELLSAPVGPAAALAAGAAAGLGAAGDPVTAALAPLLALVLALFAVACGVTLALVTGRTRRPALWRGVTLVVVMGIMASVTGSAPTLGATDLVGALAAVHAAQSASFLLPSWWSAAPLAEGGLLAWWPLIVLPLALTWIVWSAPALVEGLRRDATTGRAARRPWPQPRLPGRFGALLAKDIALLVRDGGLHAAALRHSALAAMPLIAIAAAAWFSGNDASAAARLARATPTLGLVAHLVVVAQSGLATMMIGTDGGGATHILTLPLRAEALVLSKALAWTLVFAPLVALATAGVVFAAGVASGCDGTLVWALRAGMEGLASGCAGAGAGVVVSVLWPTRSTTSHAGPPTHRTGLSGLIAGVGASAATLIAVLCVALAIHAVGGWPGSGLGLAIGCALLLVGSRLAASLLRARQEAVALALARISRRL